jgi:transposase-like protein
MNVHKNARLTAKGREQMVRAVLEGGLSKAAAARQYHTTSKTVGKWVDRFLADGMAGLKDRSSRPHSSPRQTPSSACAAVEALRRQRYPGKQIAAELGLSPATVSRILRRLGLNRLGALEPAEPVRRYERAHPGELIHIDIKKLGRIDGIGHRITGNRHGQSNRRNCGKGLGWEYVHVAIDDASRIAFALVMPDEKKQSAIAFLHAALAYYASLGVTVARLMTDNGGCYKAFDFPGCLPRSRPQAYPHQTLHAKNQRQGRTLHPDRAARMGLYQGLYPFRRQNRRTARLAAPL